MPDAAQIIANVMPVLAPFMDNYEFQVSVSRAATIEVRFRGPIGRIEIDRLIRHLEILKESAPEEAAPVPTREELGEMIRAAVSSRKNGVEHTATPEPRP